MGFGPITGNVPSIVENSEAVAANGEPMCTCLAEQVVSLESEAPRWQLLVGLEAADISSNACSQHRSLSEAATAAKKAMNRNPR